MPNPQRSVSVFLAICSFCASFTLVLPRSAAAGEEFVFRPDPDGTISSWLVAGGFGWKKLARAEAFARDELGGAANADPREGDAVTEKVKWKLVAAGGRTLNLKSQVKPKSKSGAYAFARLVVPSEREARLLVGSDDGVRIWVNGALVREHLLTRKHVADSELVPVKLVAGPNRLLFKIDQTGGRWAFSARVVDERGVPMPDATIVLRTEKPPEPARVARAFAKASRASLKVALRAGGKSHATVRYKLAAGVPDVPEPLTLSARIQGKTQSLQLSRAALANDTHALRAAIAPEKPLRATVRVTDARGHLLFERKLGRAIPQELLRTAFAAERALEKAKAHASVPEASHDSVAYTLERGRALLENGDGDKVYAKKLLGEAAASARALAKGKDPYAKKRQAFYRAYKSPFVDELQHYAAYVPSGYRKNRKYPLVIALHGFQSPTMITLRRALGSSITELSYQDGDRKLPRFKEERFLVAAPRGYGHIAFRYIAEDDILRVIEEMKRAYNVDENRIYLTGLSMGGLGTMEVGLHFPDRFAGLISNCGAADTRLYESVEGYKPTAWETQLIDGRSAVLWAENGLHTPFFIAHGLKDLINHPKNSRVLVDEYTRLGYGIESRFDPELGHNVWDRTYEKGAIWTRFLKYQREPSPLRVVFKSAHIRYAQLYWVRLQEWAQPWSFARVEATVEPAANSVKATTQNLLRFSLVLGDTRLEPGRNVRAEIDGQVVLDGPAPRELFLARDTASTPWRALSAAEAAVLAAGVSGRAGPVVAGALQKRAGLSGPIEDFKYVRQILVYGSQEPAEEPVLRRAAHDAASYHSHSGIRLQVKRDTDVTDDDVRRSHLHLFGTPRSNSWLRKIEGQLPLRITTEGVLVGEKLHKGADLGFKMIFPNPLAPDRYVMVSAGVHAHAAGWANWLPLWIPDYIVYDQRTTSPRWGKILAGRPAVSAGYFDPAWKLAPTAP